jgi:uncharacterized DUF497 family protein
MALADKPIVQRQIDGVPRPQLVFSASVSTIVLMNIEFEPAKAVANPINQEGVTFDEAKAVFLDPYALTREDTDITGDQRFVTLGMDEKGRDCWWYEHCAKIPSA